MGCGASTGNIEPVKHEDPMDIAKYHERTTNLDNFKLMNIDNYKGTKPPNRTKTMVCVDELEQKIYVFGGKAVKKDGDEIDNREAINERAMYVYHKKKWHEISESEMSGDIPPMMYDGTLSLIKRFTSPEAYEAYNRERKAKMKKKKRKKHDDKALGTIDGKVVVGGNMDANHLDEVNPDAQQQQQEEEEEEEKGGLPIASPEHFQTRLALIGGKRTKDGVPSGEIYIFYPSTGQWLEVNMIMGDWVEDSISGHSAVVYKQSIYVFGGVLNRQDFSRRVFKINLANNGVKVEKRSVPQFTITKRRHHAATVYEHYMYVVGGEARSGPKFDVWRYDLLSNEWDKLLQPVAEIPPSISFKAATHGNSVYIYNGDSPFFARLKLDQDDPKHYTWATLQIEDEGMPNWPSPSLVKLKDDLYVVAKHTSPTAGKIAFGKIIIYDSIKALKDKSAEASK